MPPVRVLFWYWGRRGAGGRYALEVIKGLAAQRDIELHLSLSRQSEFFSDCEALNLPGFHANTYEDFTSLVLRSVTLPMLRMQFGRYLAEHAIDVVYSPMTHLWNAAFLSVIRKAGVRYIFTAHEASPHQGDDVWFRDRLLGQEIKAADGLITLTSYVKSRIIDRYGYPPGRISVIPCGVFSYGEVGSEPRTLTMDRVRVLFLGRILPYKGLPLLLEAYRGLRNSCHSVTLNIVGQGDLRPYKKQLASLPGVTVVNRYVAESELGKFFDHADILVLPYTKASQSGAAPIAFSKGIPVVATPVGGLREQIRDGITGLVAKEVTPLALMEALHNLATNPELYRSCSRGALQAARGELSWDVVTNHITSVVRQVAEQPT